MSTPAAVSQDDIRRHNTSRLLRLLHQQGATSRSELAALTGLNRSTVKALTAELVAARLVRERAPVGRGVAGRPSIVVEPESVHTYSLALDIGVDHLIAARVGLGGVVLDRRELRQARAGHDVRRTVERVHRLLTAMLASAPPDAVCIGLGAGVAGVVSADDGTVRFAPNLGWVDVPLGQMLAERLEGRFPVTVGNDGDAGALAEHSRGAAAGFSDVIYISGEVGVGGGVIIGGRPFRGAGGFAGEIGHMTVNSRGRRCRCGRRGCWETEIGQMAVLEATGAAPDAALADVLAAYEAGDRRTVSGLRQVGRSVGTGAVNLVNLFNPQIIVFGGQTRGVFTATEPIVREVLTTALAAPREQVTLRVAALGPDSTLIGAAELAFDAFLTDPLRASSVRSDASHA